jgi:hypothetical protein
MRQFVGKYMDVLQRDKGAAVMQLALQQPDASAVFCAAASQRSSEQPTLEHSSGVTNLKRRTRASAHTRMPSALWVGSTRIVCGSGNFIFVYDAESQELIEEIEGTSGVKSVAIWDGGKEGGKNTSVRSTPSAARGSP